MQFSIVPYWVDLPVLAEEVRRRGDAVAADSVRAHQLWWYADLIYPVVRYLVAVDSAGLVVQLHGDPPWESALLIRGLPGRMASLGAHRVRRK